jgi:hypothetical protein
MEKALFPDVISSLLNFDFVDICILLPLFLLRKRVQCPLALPQGGCFDRL